METSDSECFESAGEEFYSDDEATVRSEKEVLKKTRNLNINEKSKNANEVDSKTIEQRQISDRKEEGDLTVADRKGDSDSENEKRDRYLQELQGFSIPPTRTVCWEPGMDYEIDETEYNKNDKIINNATETLDQRDGLQTITTIQKDLKNEVKEVVTKEKSESVVPPGVEQCWEEGVNAIPPIKNKPKSKQSEYAEPPEIVQCWEEDVNTIPLKNKPLPCKPKINAVKKSEFDKSSGVNVVLSEAQTSNSDDTPGKPTPPPIEQCVEADVPTKNPNAPRPEFGIPPRIAVCPFPVQHRNKVKAEKLIGKKEETEENMWENDDWLEEDSPIEVDNSKLKTEDSNSNLETSKIKLVSDDFETKSDTCQTKQDQSEKEKNMWEDDTWDDFEVSNEPRPQDSPKQENKWEDDWEPIENIPKIDSKTNIQEDPKKDTGWGAWGSWGLSSVISTATTITNQVSQSITTVLESGIGAPNPEELAKLDRKIEKELQNISDEEQEEEKQEETPILGFALGSIVHGVTKLVETTGSKVITGGLDTLETIGKKTMEVLQENDPGLKKKRAFLKLNDDKPILSHMLREAKEKAEKENQELVKKHLDVKKPNYETLFDDHQGLVHLEALEMLSKQCDIKLSTLLDASSDESLIEMQETMGQIKELCELPEDEEEEILTSEDIKEKLETGLKELNVPITYERLLSTWQDVDSWLGNVNLSIIDSKELHQQAIESLAQLTAIAVEQFHKGGELLLIKQHRSTADEADSLVQLTVTLTALIGIVSAKFSEKLNTALDNGADKKEVNELITNVFYEAANSSTYIRDAFQLLIPVLQVGAF